MPTYLNHQLSRLKLLAAAAVMLALACTGSPSQPTESAPTATLEPTTGSTSVPTSTPAASPTSTVPPPTPTAASASIPEAVRNISGTVVEIRIGSGGGEGVFLTNGVIYDPSGLVIAGSETIDDLNRQFPDAGAIYIIAVVDRSTGVRQHIPATRLGTSAQLGVTVFQLDQGGPWPSAQLLNSSQIQPGSNVYSIGITEKRYSIPTIQHIEPGIFVTTAVNDNIREIVHETDISGIPGDSPVFDSNGKLIGINLRSVRRFVGDRFVPTTIAVPAEEMIALLPELESSADSVPKAVSDRLSAVVEVRSGVTEKDSSFIANGVIYDSSGLVLTGRWSTANSSYLYVVITDPVSAEREVVPATKLGWDSELRLAVLKLDMAGPWPFAPLAPAVDASPGSSVFTIGRGSDTRAGRSPAKTVEEGEILATVLVEGTVTLEHSTDLVALSMPTPLFDRSGNLIGMNSNSERVFDITGKRTTSTAVSADELISRIPKMETHPFAQIPLAFAGPEPDLGRLAQMMSGLTVLSESASMVTARSALTGARYEVELYTAPTGHDSTEAWANELHSAYAATLDGYTLIQSIISTGQDHIFSFQYRFLSEGKLMTGLDLYLVRMPSNRHERIRMSTLDEQFLSVFNSEFLALGKAMDAGFASSRWSSFSGDSLLVTTRAPRSVATLHFTAADGSPRRLPIQALVKLKVHLWNISDQTMEFTIDEQAVSLILDTGVLVQPFDPQERAEDDPGSSDFQRRFSDFHLVWGTVVLEPGQSLEFDLVFDVEYREWPVALRWHAGDEFEFRFP